MPTTPRGFPMLTADQQYALVVDYNKLAIKADAEATVTEARAREVADAAKEFARQAADGAERIARTALSKVEPVRALVDAANAKSDHAVTTAEAAYAYNEALGSGDVKAQVDAVVLDTASESGALVASKADAAAITIDPRRFGGTPLADGSGAGADSTDALEAAIAHAKTLRTFTSASRRIHLNGWYKISRDLVLDDNDLIITGEGGNSGILGINSGVLIDGRAGLVQRVQLRDMRVRRVTTADKQHGTALDIVGGAANIDKYPCRMSVSNVLAESPIHPAGLTPTNAVALKLRGTFLGTFTDVYLRNAHDGLRIDLDPVAGNLGANAITFMGGEIQGVKRIGQIARAIGVTFLGMPWEGATEEGMTVDNTHGLTVIGTYWENNGGFDLKVGATTSVDGVTIVGGTSSVGMRPKERSIILTRARGVDISGIYYYGYTSSPIFVNEATAGAVSGGVANCYNSKGGTPVVEVAAGRDWGITTSRGMSIIHETGAALLQLDAPAGQQRATQLRTAGSLRWAYGTDAISESGSNAGSNWQLIAYSDTGGYLGAALTVYRSTQQVRIHSDLWHSGSKVGFFGKLPVARPTLKISGNTADEVALALSTLGLVNLA